MQSLCFVKTNNCLYIAINVYTIYEFIGNEDYDIPDPYGQSIQVYRDVRNELDSLMETLYYRLIDYDAD